MEYKWIKSRRKTISVEVSDNLEVVVRSPYITSKINVENFLASNTKWIENQKAVLQKRQASPMLKPLDEKEKQILKQQALRYIPSRVCYYSKIMNVNPTAIKITSAQKRFGSCSGKNSLCFSFRLMQYSNEQIDYVVVHELAHIRHKNHSSSFYDFVGQVLPNYKEIQKELKQI